MIEELLGKSESKNLEFKENSQSLSRIVKTVIAFANTSGGKIIIGIKDKTNEIVGVKNALLEEERIANSIAESISPLISPDIEIQTYRNKEIIIVHVYHGVGPYYLKAIGEDKGVYIRFGSTNRVADANTIYNLKLLAQNTTFDALPYPKNSAELDWPFIKSLFNEVGKNLIESKSQLLGILTEKAGKIYPTIGAMILFGLKREIYFPDAIIRCARFSGTERLEFIDQLDIKDYFPVGLEQAIAFIKRNTSTRSIIKEIKRKDIPQYPLVALRESIVNAIVHTDYSIKGSTITIAIFNDRIEIENPGGLPFGLTIEQALGGSSKLRNQVIGGVFRELKLIERWGTGIKRIQDACREQGLKAPEFQELNNQFKVTLYSAKEHKVIILPWQKKLLNYLETHKEINNKEAAKLWDINPRTARSKLKQMLDMGLIKKIATSAKDPYAFFVINK